MPRDDSSPSRDPERKRAEAARDTRPGGWAPRRGRSGYGVESIRPHLRAQLEERRLMRPTFPPEDPTDDDPGHR